MLDPCNCELCWEYEQRGYLWGRKWADYLVEHPEYALENDVFYYYYESGVYYMLKDERPYEIERLGLEAGLLPEHFDTHDVEPMWVYETPFRETELVEIDESQLATPL